MVLKSTTSYSVLVLKINMLLIDDDGQLTKHDRNIIDKCVFLSKIPRVSHNLKRTTTLFILYSCIPRKAYICLHILLPGSTGSNEIAHILKYQGTRP